MDRNRKKNCCSLCNEIVSGKLLDTNVATNTSKWLKRSGRIFVPNSVILLKTSLQSETEFPQFAWLVEND